MWWLVYERQGKRCVWLEEDSSLVGARMKVTMATKQSDGFLEAHKLDRKMVRKVPKDLTRKWLSTAQARKLLDQLG
jgi:hypothetical protein